MSKATLGLDIGASSIKLAVVSEGFVKKMAVEPLPDNLVREGRVLSPEALAQVLKEMMKKHGIRTKKCSLVLPPEAALARRISMPYMTIEQLLVNLPYEFHDYIHGDKDSFFYDYAVVGEEMEADEKGDGQVKKLDLLAGAIRKDMMATYRILLGKAGLKLATALPDCFTYRNLIRWQEEEEKEGLPREHGFVDLGHTAIRLHIYQGSIYETTRIIEYGGASLDALIADRLDVDEHLAANYKMSNYENVQELEECRELYDKIALELKRALNFYGFNNPDSDLGDLYFSGGLSAIPALMERVRDTLDVNVHLVSQMMPETKDEEQSAYCPAAVGVTLQ